MAIRGTIYWRICDLSQFYLNISKEIHSVDDTGSHTIQTFRRDAKFEVAEQWLLAMAEEKTRTIVSQIGTGLLIADQLSSDLESFARDDSVHRRFPAVGSRISRRN